MIRLCIPSMREIHQSGEHRGQNKYNENKVIRRKISYYGKIKSAIYQSFSHVRYGISNQFGGRHYLHYTEVKTQSFLQRVLSVEVFKVGGVPEYPQIAILLLNMSLTHALCLENTLK